MNGIYEFLAENWGTIVTGMSVAGIAVAILVKIFRDRQKGKCAGCDCGCANCSGQSGCGAR